MAEMAAEPTTQVQEMLYQLAQEVNKGHQLQAQYDELQRDFTTIGRRLLELREGLTKEGLDVTFSLSKEVMEGIERASSEPKVAMAPPSL